LEEAILQASPPVQRPPSECVKRPEFFLRMSAWGDLPDAGRYRFYDALATFMLLARGASFARLPGPEELASAPLQLLPVLFQRLRALGGAPETFGVCVAAPDFPAVEGDYRRDPRRYWPGAISEEAAAALAEHTRRSLSPGRYCHGSALDRRPWSDLQVSPLELQEGLARDVLQGRRVLVLRGTGTGPADADLRAPLRLTASASALEVPTSATADLAGVLSLLAEMDALLNEAAQPTEVLLLVGLPTGVGAFLALEVGCRHPSVQALDAGLLLLAGPRGASRPPQAPAPLTTALQAFVAHAHVAGTGGSAEWDPRPHFLRPGVERLDLNGPWELLVTAGELSPVALPREPWPESIHVPFAPQAHSGSATKVSAYEVIWYRRWLRLPSAWCERAAGLVYLQVDACDWECRFFMDRMPIAAHRGAYDPFVLGPLDLSPSACLSGVELLVSAWDPTDMGCEFTDVPPIPCDQCCESGWQPRGKQSLRPGFIMYSGISGLWRQGLWLERRPPCHLSTALATPRHGAVAVSASASCGGRLSVELRPRGETIVIASAEGPCCEVLVPLAQPLRPWSPDAPAMYEAVLSLDGGADIVVCSFAYRELAVKEGRVLLNGLPIFMHGVLYQGYWPESLLTPPGPAPGGPALEQDLRAIKEAGFNTVRVHAVVMGAVFYALCDVLGLLVWQDMPAGDSRAMPVWERSRGEAEEELLHQAGAAASGALGAGGFDEIRRTPESEEAFDRELQAMVAWLAPFPCVAVWVLFNEGWGQSRTAARVQWLRAADPRRLIDAASGWNELAAAPPLGDFADVHNYEGSSSAFGPLQETFQHWPFQLGARVRALGEYGGLGYAVSGHEWVPTAGTAWGYGGKVHQDAEAYQAALEVLLGRLLPLLCGGGLGAAIYTQWTDVESETNGLLTYDRHPKLPLEALRAYSSSLLAAYSHCTRG